MIEQILQIMGGITVVCGGLAAIYKGYKLLTDGHDTRQKYEEYDTRINALDTRVTELDTKVQKQILDAHSYAQDLLEKMQESNDKKLEEMQTNIDGKLQQISAELCMLSYCTLANLDGLKQQGCNGKVTEAREKLEKHLNQQAHGELH